MCKSGFLAMVDAVTSPHSTSSDGGRAVGHRGPKTAALQNPWGIGMWRQIAVPLPGTLLPASLLVINERLLF